MADRMRVTSLITRENSRSRDGQQGFVLAGGSVPGRVVDQARPRRPMTKGRRGRLPALRKDVVVASGSVVVLDDGRDVEGERPEVINAAAHALPIAAAVVCFPAL